MDVNARRLERAERKVAILEQLIEDKTREIYDANAVIEKDRSFLNRVFDSMSSALWVFNFRGRIEMANEAAFTLVGVGDEPPPIEFAYIFPDLQFEDLAPQLRVETRLCRGDGSYLPVMFGATTTGSGPDLQLIVNCVDLSEKKRLEGQLQNAQKLEAVGQLAAGVAHEVNTPIQFISDGVRFLKECVGDLATGWTARSELFDALRSRGHLSAADERAIASIDNTADVDFLFAEAPAAAERTLRGVGRVAEIVRALRAFAHPDGDMCAPSDVNSAIRDAAIVATGEYKQVASLKLDLEDLPSVECNLGELNQVFLNLIVNAAHAIADRQSESPGLISITSRVEPGGVCVRVTDNGAGVPEAVRSRIFEPFFTTKPLGKGTGQGLALAHPMVEVRHGGQLTFETESGVGTTFIVRLPLSRVQKVSRAA